MAAHPQRTEKSATLIITVALEMAALPPGKQSAYPARSVQPGAKSSDFGNLKMSRQTYRAVAGTFWFADRQGVWFASAMIIDKMRFNR
jgi:hypothetical protein